jgi:ubiquinone/menaquinone biosynthesis C-methylase UbiE
VAAAKHLVMENQKNHWEKIYSTKQPNEVSWTQEVPKTSLDFIHNANLSKSASIIDIGGGDSKLVDYLLAEGFENITVLDISEQALERAKQRLGDKAQKVNWIATNIMEFEPPNAYDLWHDRAAFHFLTTEPQIVKYLSTARKAVKENGVVTIGTFSTDGPKKCSGLDIKQYSEETLTSELQNGFEKIKCVTEDHTTPFNTTQNFLFCSFKRKNEGQIH